jgi:hypothetical protein
MATNQAKCAKISVWRAGLDGQMRQWKQLLCTTMHVMQCLASWWYGVQLGCESNAMLSPGLA